MSDSSDHGTFLRRVVWAFDATPQAWKWSYLLIAIPTLALLCFATGPFQVPDEANHFLRITQILGGQIVPTLAPDGKSAGGLVDQGALDLTARFVTRGQNSTANFDLSAIKNLASIPQTRSPTFASFSNTAIYFPLAYIVPLVVIAPLKLLGAPPLAWMYAGRLGDALLGIILVSLVLGRLRTNQRGMFVAALLPMVLFEEASVSADALLVPISVLFSWALSELLATGTLTRLQTGALAASMVFLGLSKFAYLPLVVIPPFASLLVQRRLSSTVIVLSVAAILTAIVLAGWAHLLNGMVFPGPGRDGEPRAGVDINGQLAFVIGHPLHFVFVVLNSMLRHGYQYVMTMTGWVLGWGDVRLPLLLVLASFLILVAGLLFDTRPTGYDGVVAAFSIVMVAGSVVAIFLLLYMQFTPLGARSVDGIQGRYFLPYLPILVIVLPKWPLSRLSFGAISLATVAWAILGAGTTISYVTLHYWPM